MDDATMRNAYSGQKKTMADNEKVKNIVRQYVDLMLWEEQPDLVEMAKQALIY